ncbi:MAG: hypothetical protein CH6_2773 [Candidatus Kapaibacterium sp.]|nr:MAG: hypothetical protein CH6_2773 [Candidatus Kapabacteria bacterium]
MRRYKYIQIFSFIFRIVLGVVFIYAAIGKIDNPSNFFKEISNYQLFPAFLSQVVAIVLPWIELLIGVFLIFGLRIRANSFISLVLLVVFTLLVISAWARGLNINCGCFSHTVEYVGLKKVIDNLLMIVGSLIVFLFPDELFSIERLIYNQSSSKTESEIS